MDHRRLQRTLFRMQHDAAFAERLLHRDAAAEASTGLGGEELACLRAVDPAALSADRGGRRMAQLLRNVASELPLSVALGPDGAGSRGWIDAFPASTLFHEAVARDESLPCAFAAHAVSVAESATPAFRALVSLEAALVRARRRPRPMGQQDRPRGHVKRSRRAELLALPAGSFALAGRVREALDVGDAPCGPSPGAFREDARETLLVVARPPVSRWTLPELHVEPLPDLVASFLEAAGRALSPTDRAAFAKEHGLAEEPVEALVREFVAEGALDQG